MILFPLRATLNLDSSAFNASTASEWSDLPAAGGLLVLSRSAGGTPVFTIPPVTVARYRIGSRWLLYVPGTSTTPVDVIQYGTTTSVAVWTLRIPAKRALELIFVGDGAFARRIV